MVRCTSCGYQMKIDENDSNHTCEACGNSFVVTQAQELNKIVDFDEKSLQNMRSNLKRSITSNDLNEIQYFSREIIKIIPDDFKGKYFYAYASSKLGNPNLLNEFLSGKEYVSTQQDKTEVTKHIARNLDLRDRKKILNYIEHNDPSNIKYFEEVFQERIQLEDNYAVVKRDVFVCHRSIDIAKAEEVVRELEQDGHKCWISSRNLRPNDNENYWMNIEEAISHSEIFLVVSSQDAMLSKDVQKEVLIASKLKKKRLEYKIDNYRHTTLFKSFFDGIKWIDASTSKNANQLLVRVFDLLSKPNKQDTIEISKKEPATSTQKIDSLVKRMYLELEIESFEKAESIIDSIIDIDLENEDAWIGRLLVEKQISTYDHMIESISSYNLNQIEAFTNSNAYKALLKFNSKNKLAFSVDKTLLKSIKFEKEKAMLDLDLVKFTNVSSKYPEKIDDFYKILISNKITSISRLELYLKNPSKLNILKNIFENSQITSLISEPEISKYYKEYENLLSNYIKEQERKVKEEQERLERIAKEEKEKKERLAKEEQERIIKEENKRKAARNQFYIRVNDYIKAGDYELAKTHLLDNKYLYSSEMEYVEYVVYVKYQIPRFEIFNELTFSIEEKREIIKDPNILNLYSNNHNKDLISVIDKYTYEVEAYDQEQKRLRKLEIEQKNRKIIKYSSIFVSIILVIISLFVVYDNMKVNIAVNLDGGILSSYKNTFLNKDLPYTLPIPNKIGYTFDGWYTDNDYENEIEEVTSGFFKTEEIYAKWSINQYTISFEENNRSLVENVTQDYGTTVNEPSVDREGYTFGGWYLDSSFTTEYTFTTMPSEDITVYAKWSINQYTISFEENNGSVVEDITQDYATTVNEPSIEREGYSLSGWYLDSEFTQPYTFRTMPAENITLYAKWMFEPHTITLELNGGTGQDSIYDDYGTELETPTVEKEGYKFSGWYSDEMLQTPYTFTTMPSEDITVYAKWSINQYTISFEENNGSVVEDITQDYATTVNEPSIEREGYSLSGWYLDSEFTQPYTFRTMPAENITLYAKWIAQFVVTFDTNGGNNLDYIYVDPNNKLSILPTPSREGYAFGGWYKDSALLIALDFNTIIDSDMTLYAKWFEIPGQYNQEILIGDGFRIFNGTWNGSITAYEHYFYFIVTKQGNYTLYFDPESSRTKFNLGIQGILSNGESVGLSSYNSDIRKSGMYSVNFNLEPGIYFIRLSTMDTKTWSIKIS
jgi:uncharacterized repeat protein (TIGR02543 family)